MKRLNFGALIICALLPLTAFAAVTSYSTTPSNNNSAPPNGAPEAMAPSAVNDVIRQVMTDIAVEAQKNQVKVLASVAGTNTITGTMTPDLTGYSAGMMAVFTPAATNTGATTLNVDTLGALDVQKYDGDALIAGDLVVGVPALLVLDSGADDWILVNPQTADFGVAVTATGGNSGLAYGSGENFARINNTVATGWGGLSLQRQGTDVVEFLEVGGSTSTGALRVGIRNGGTFRDQLTVTPTAWNFGNATDNPSYSFLGTGTATFNGPIALTGTTAQRATINSSAAAGPYVTFQRSGVSSSDVGSGGNCGASFTTDALGLCARSGNPVEIAAGGRTSPDIQITSAGAINLNQPTAVLSALTIGGSNVCRADGVNCPLTQTSGNVVVSFDDACTTTPTITFGYVKIGSMVTMHIKTSSGWPCTSDSANTLTTATPLPAAIRPAQDRVSPIIAMGVDNGVANSGCMVAVLATGSMTISRVSTSLQVSAWTPSGSKNPCITYSESFSYMLIDP